MVPQAIFTAPEVAVVGLMDNQAVERGYSRGGDCQVVEN
jgi:pyruvate/2-oxoglutarate dehydrogenase complex dihydrolipoamide dehydrogenase (E3) component